MASWMIVATLQAPAFLRCPDNGPSKKRARLDEEGGQVIEGIAGVRQAVCENERANPRSNVGSPTGGRWDHGLLLRYVMLCIYVYIYISGE